MQSSVEKGEVSYLQYTYPKRSPGVAFEGAGAVAESLYSRHITLATEILHILTSKRSNTTKFELNMDPVSQLDESDS